MKKLCSILLALVIVFSLGTIAVQAEDNIVTGKGAYPWELHLDTGHLRVVSSDSPNLARNFQSGDLYDMPYEYRINVRSISFEGLYSGLGNRAFYGAYTSDVVYPNVEHIALAPSMTWISDYAFAGLTKLREIEMPGKVTHIGEGAFNRCTSLTELRIPGSVKTIPRYLAENSGLQRVIFEEGVQSIASWAFYNCTALETLYLPSTIESFSLLGLAPDQYQGMSNPQLQNIHVAPGGAYYSSVDGVLFNADQTILLGYPPGRKEAVYTVPDGTLEVRANFSHQKDHYLAVVLPESIQSVDFANMTGEYFVPPEVKTFNRSNWSEPCAFSLVGYAGSSAQAFADERGIKFYPVREDGVVVPHEITIRLVSPPVLGTWFELNDVEEAYVFPGDTAAFKTVIRPALSANQQVVWWSPSSETIIQLSDDGVVTGVGPGKACINAVALENGVMASCNIEVFPDRGQCGDNVFWELITDWDSEAPDYYKILKLTGTGSIWNYTSAKEPPWPQYLAYALRAVSRLVLEDGITRIGEYAFWNTPTYDSIELPRSLTEIGYRAFTYRENGHELPNYTTIRCYKDSFAHQAALSNGNDIILLDDSFTLVNTTTGVKLEYPANALPEGATMTVSAVSEGQLAELYQYANYFTKPVIGFTLYDIKLWHEGAAIQPSAPVKLYLPLPANFDPARFQVCYVNPADGMNPFVSMAYTIEGNYAVVETDHFSLFGFVELGKDNKPPREPTNWRELPVWLQFILRWFFFGWIWMK